MTYDTTVSINPLGVYTTDQVCEMLDVSEATLVEARRDGALRAVRKGRRVLYLGEWVLEWLRKSDPVGAGPAKLQR